MNASTPASPLSPLRRLARRFEEQVFEYNETNSSVRELREGWF
ncbi:MAG TPA: hypothetical protein VN281_18800 [Verrucomicrobiae bacterium]|nr:hypothetical protein [Verrucomicrobiae bacterium]